MVAISGDDSRPADVTGNVVISWYVDYDIWPEPLPACQYHDATSPSYSRWHLCNYYSGLGQSLLFLEGSSVKWAIFSHFGMKECLFMCLCNRYREQTILSILTKLFTQILERKISSELVSRQNRLNSFEIHLKFKERYFLNGSLILKTKLTKKKLVWYCKLFFIF